MNPIVVDPFASALHLHHDGTVRPGERRMLGSGSHWTLAAFRVTDPTQVHPDHWERHPDADEVVWVLDGEAQLVTRDQEQWPERRVGSGHRGTAALRSMRFLETASPATAPSRHSAPSTASAGR
jgi:hypothetical protein